MTHVLSFGNRNSEDDASEEIALKIDDQVPDEPVVDIHNYRVPSDAAFLKYFTPKYISSNGSKPRYMWASRDLCGSRDYEQPPIYSVTGFGLLDACLHAYACNSILVLHPLDILLNLCYTYGNHRKKPLSLNNEDLKKITQIRLRRPFTRSHLILASVARMARRIETYPLPKLFSLINTELNSPDPTVVRLAIGVICYLAGTRETTRLTVEHMRGLFEIAESSEALMEPSLHNNWTIAPTGVLDVRHDVTQVASRRPRSFAKDVNNQQAVTRRNSQIRAATGDLEVPTDATDVISTSAVAWKPGRSDRIREEIRRQSDQLNPGTPREDSARDEDREVSGVSAGVNGTADLIATNERRVSGGQWHTMLDTPFETGLGGTAAEAENRTQNFQEAINEARNDASAARNTGAKAVEFHRHQMNNANQLSVKEAEDWTPKKIVPSSIYKIKKDNGIASLKLLGNRRAWAELPEMMQELGVFFGVEKRVQNEFLEIGLKLQATRLNINQSIRKFWESILFKNGQPKLLPDADYQIDGWLSTLLGARLFNEQTGMNLRHLADMKTGVRVPVLLVRLPNREADGDESGAAPSSAPSVTISDDGVLDGTEIGRQKMRLHYYDEYREKLVLNSSGNAAETPVGLFLPWRSCEAVNRTRRLWRHVGGDSPTMMSRTIGEALRGPAARNLNNVDSSTTVSRRSDLSMPPADDELAVREWTVRSRKNAKSRSCCGCRSKRTSGNQSEPAYNMCCLMSGICGFTVEPGSRGDLASNAQTNRKRSYVRPICFFEIAFEQ